MRKVVILHNEGFASGITDNIGMEEKTVSHWQNPILQDILQHDIADYLEIHSTWCRSRKEMKEYLLHPYQNMEVNDLFISSKSMGCVETYDFFNLHYKDLRYKNIYWFCLDGHSKLLKHWYRRKFGEKKSFKKKPEWDRMVIYNVYQQKEKPKGANFERLWLGDSNIKLQSFYKKKGKNSVENILDHFTIIKHPQTLESFTNMCNIIKERLV